MLFPLLLFFVCLILTLPPPTLEPKKRGIGLPDKYKRSIVHSQILDLCFKN